jgi:hypothetical protein
MYCYFYEHYSFVSFIEPFKVEEALQDPNEVLVGMAILPAGSGIHGYPTPRFRVRVRNLTRGSHSYLTHDKIGSGTGLIFYPQVLVDIRNYFQFSFFSPPETGWPNVHLYSITRNPSLSLTSHSHARIHHHQSLESRNRVAPALTLPSCRGAARVAGWLRPCPNHPAATQHRHSTSEEQDLGECGSAQPAQHRSTPCVRCPWLPAQCGSAPAACVSVSEVALR